MNGAKRTTEAMDCVDLRIYAVVEERSTALRLTVRIASCCRSENVGISNEKIGEIPVRRKSKVSVRAVHPLRVSRYPKPRPVGVGDGQQVKYSCTTL